MATSEALVKYYDCLKESFNKIQDKDNKAALVNAALRPKISEEFVKSQDVLNSYLNYIQVFSLIYSDKFSEICRNILAPLLKEDQSLTLKENDTDTSVSSTIATKVIEAVQTIICSRPELADDFIHSMIRIFPSVVDKKPGVFLRFLSHCLKISTHLKGEALNTLLAKIFERMDYTSVIESEKEELNIRTIIQQSYELIYQHISTLDHSHLHLFSKSFLLTFISEFIVSPNQKERNLLILYLCSLDNEFSELLIESCWKIVVDTTKSLIERRRSAIFVSSFLSRAKYLDLEKIFLYTEKAIKWCHQFLSNYTDDNDLPTSANENVEIFYVLSHSVFYIITQRYRELYEEESIKRLIKLELDSLICSALKPMEICDPEIASRFSEVASLYSITEKCPDNVCTPSTKRRKRDSNAKQPARWTMPFDENMKSLPDRLKPLYCDYFDHRNFTVYRD